METRRWPTEPLIHWQGTESWDAVRTSVANQWSGRVGDRCTVSFVLGPGWLRTHTPALPWTRTLEAVIDAVCIADNTVDRRNRYGRFLDAVWQRYGRGRGRVDDSAAVPTLDAEMLVLAGTLSIVGEQALKLFTATLAEKPQSLVQRATSGISIKLEDSSELVGLLRDAAVAADLVAEHDEMEPVGRMECTDFTHLSGALLALAEELTTKPLLSLAHVDWLTSMLWLCITSHDALDMSTDEMAARLYLRMTQDHRPYIFAGSLEPLYLMQMIPTQTSPEYQNVFETSETHAPGDLADSICGYLKACAQSYKAHPKHRDPAIVLLSTFDTELETRLMQIARQYPQGGAGFKVVTPVLISKKLPDQQRTAGVKWLVGRPTVSPDWCPISESFSWSFLSDNLKEENDKESGGFFRGVTILRFCGSPQLLTEHAMAPILDYSRASTAENSDSLDSLVALSELNVVRFEYLSGRSLPQWFRQRIASVNQLKTNPSRRWLLFGERMMDWSTRVGLIDLLLADTFSGQVVGPRGVAFVQSGQTVDSEGGDPMEDMHRLSLLPWMGVLPVLAHFHDPSEVASVIEWAHSVSHLNE